MAKIVLRKGAGPNGDSGKDGFAADGKDWRDFAVDETPKLFGRELCGGRIGGAADKTR